MIDLKTYRRALAEVANQLGSEKFIENPLNRESKCKFDRDPDVVDRALTLSAAHRLIQSLSEQTQSRAELDECRDVMAALERMVEEG